MNFYNNYKPLRNYFRRFPMGPSLGAIWALSQEVIEHSSDVRADIVGRPLQYRELPFLPWQIETLCREIVLNAAEVGGERSLLCWKDLAKAFNHIISLEDQAFKANGTTMDVMMEVHRLPHRQFPWQSGFSVNSVLRAIKIFGKKEVDDIVTAELGMTVVQVTALGLSLAGHYAHSPALQAPESYLQLGISRDALQAYFDRTCYSLFVLREKTKEQQRYDHDWAYTFDPLVERPLISVGTNQGPRILCPIPRFLSQRATAGLYFDIARSKAFSNPYGTSFETYVGEVLRTTCPGPTFSLIPETPYKIGRQEYRGQDWIWTDPTAHVFIEAKTKRMRLDAKTQSDPAALERELEVMAGLVVQHYANIDRALKGHVPNWAADARPIVPMIVTLEDWYLLGPAPADILLAKVRFKLVDEKLDPKLVTTIPFIIVSINDLELASQAMAKVGLGPVFLKIREQPFMSHSGLWNFIHSHFSYAAKGVSANIFAADLDRFTDEVKALLFEKT